MTNLVNFIIRRIFLNNIITRQYWARHLPSYLTSSNLEKIREDYTTKYTKSYLWIHTFLWPKAKTQQTWILLKALYASVEYIMKYKFNAYLNNIISEHVFLSVKTRNWLYQTWATTNQSGMCTIWRHRSPLAFQSWKFTKLMWWPKS